MPWTASLSLTLVHLPTFDTRERRPACFPDSSAGPDVAFHVTNRLDFISIFSITRI